MVHYYPEDQVLNGTYTFMTSIPMGPSSLTSPRDLSYMRCAPAKLDCLLFPKFTTTWGLGSDSSPTYSFAFPTPPNIHAHTQAHTSVAPS